MRKAAILIAVTTLVARSAFAPGTLELDEIGALLRQKPELSRPLLAAYDLNTTITGVRLGAHFTRLNGRRIGPYDIEGRPRGTHGRYDVRISVCTQVSFLDRRGKPSDMFGASDVKETLVGFIVQSNGGRMECPN